MGTLQLLLLIGFLFAMMVGGYLIIAGPSAGKEGARRLQAVRYRHSESTDTKVESQLKKAIAARNLPVAISGRNFSCWALVP